MTITAYQNNNENNLNHQPQASSVPAAQLNYPSRLPLSLPIISAIPWLDSDSNQRSPFQIISQSPAGTKASDVRNNGYSMQRDKSRTVVLRSTLFPLNYAKANDIASLLKDKANGFLSDSGVVIVDARTNRVWVQDLGDNLPRIKQFIQQLDIPVTQVQIEARLVNVNTEFERDIGIRFGVTHLQHLTGTLSRN